MSPRTRAYLELIRPANVVTAFADILAGFAAAGAMARLFSAVGAPNIVDGPFAGGLAADLAWLLLSTAGLYAGGVVLNDVFDAELDAVERPERAIPSGRVPRRRAAAFGSALLVIGVAAASMVGVLPLFIAAFVATCAVLYDAFGKHQPILGPVNMGLCRGGNLLLGVSVVPATVGELWFLAAIPVAYISAVTAVSAGEVLGGTRASGMVAILLVGGVTAALLVLGIRIEYSIVHALPFIALLVLLVFPPLVRASVEPSPDRLRTAVKVGVLSLVVMDAALAAGFGGWPAGLVVLALLPVSFLLGRAFAVT